MKQKSFNDLYKLYLVILEACMDTIREFHHSHYANDIKSYQSIILCRITKSLRTMIQILETSKDPISGYCLLRTIADSICTYCLIYENNYHEEVELRHYLYLLDGCSQFISAYPSILNNNDLVEEDNNQNVIDQEKTDLIDFQNKLLIYINNTHIVLTFPKETKAIIDNKDWKFRSITSYSKRDSYNWRDIYKKTGFDDSLINFLSVILSQFVHGLFLSNTRSLEAKAHDLLIISNAITLERRLIRAIFHCFREDNIKRTMLGHINLNSFEDLNIDIKSILSLIK